VHFTKVQNAVAVGLPDRTERGRGALHFAHEVAGAWRHGDRRQHHPADRRAGKTARYEQSAAVRAGALLLERVLPTRCRATCAYYLQTAGRRRRTIPRGVRVVFAVPDAINDAIARQIEVILGGI
jgi:hypothetical protein